MFRPFLTSPRWLAFWFEDRLTGGMRYVRKEHAAAVCADVDARFPGIEENAIFSQEDALRNWGPRTVEKFTLDVGGMVFADAKILTVAHLDGLEVRVRAAHHAEVRQAFRRGLWKSGNTGLWKFQTPWATLIFDEQDRQVLAAGLDACAEEANVEAAFEDERRANLRNPHLMIARNISKPRGSS